jgi:predicted deacylase
MSNKIIEIGNAKARAGEIVEGSIEVTKHAGGNDLLIPFTIINGINDGPCFWINGGIHGDEPEGVLTCSILRKKIDPKNLSGSLVLMPVMNIPAMEAASRGNPLDTFSYDMNRIYPGKENGYLSERIAHEHKKWLTKTADIEISIHSGGSHSYLSETIFATQDTNAQELARAMGEAWDLSLYAIRPSGSPMTVMAELGKPAITVELGGRSSTAPGAFQKVGDTLSDAALNIMKHYKMIEGQAKYASKRYKGHQQALLAPNSGVFLPANNVKFHNLMKKGDLIAKIIDYKGNEISSLYAPEDGMIFGLRALPNVTTGDWCCFYAIIEGTWDN